MHIFLTSSPHDTSVDNRAPKRGAQGQAVGRSSPADSTAQLVNKAKSENRTQASHNVVREADFKKTEQELKVIKAQLEAKR